MEEIIQNYDAGLNISSQNIFNNFSSKQCTLFCSISIYKIQIFSVNTQTEKCTLKKKKLRFSYILTHSGADCEEVEQSTPDLEELEERTNPK